MTATLQTPTQAGTTACPKLSPHTWQHHAKAGQGWSPFPSPCPILYKPSRGNLAPCPMHPGVLNTMDIPLSPGLAGTCHQVGNPGVGLWSSDPSPFQSGLEKKEQARKEPALTLGTGGRIYPLPLPSTSWYSHCAAGFAPASQEERGPSQPGPEHEAEGQEMPGMLSLCKASPGSGGRSSFPPPG